MLASKKLSVILAVIFMLLLGAVIYKRYMTAPDIQLKDIEIATFLEEKTTLDNIKDKVIVFNVWATWCPPCIQEMPMFDHLFQEMNGQDIEFILASDEEMSKLIRFTKEHALAVPVYQLTAPMKTLGVHTIPCTFIFDKKGKLVEKKLGIFESAEELKALIRPYL